MAATLWDYPFGGGEEYIRQTMEWTKDKMDNYWLSFSDPNNNAYTEFRVEQKDCYVSINVPGGLNIATLVNWLKLLRPNVVHHQGHHHKIFHDACEQLRIEFITGIHFWTGFIKLGPTFNTDILTNLDHHTVDPIFSELSNSKYCTIYSVSDYVTDVIRKVTKYNIKYTVYSGSDEKNNLVTNFSPDRFYVTVLNIHRLKGGQLILDIIRRLPDVSFIVVQTEPGSEDLDHQIYTAIQEPNRAPGLYVQRCQTIKSILARTKIMLIPSIVDETFCRTAHEALMNSIPVLTTGKGNLSYLINFNYCITDFDNVDEWVTKIKKLLTDNELYSAVSKKMRNQYEKYSETQCRNNFELMLTDVLNKSKNKNIMIICPWCDQGLGIQSRNYARILHKHNYNVFIFSYKPYNSNRCCDLQTDPDEWSGFPVYYSTNDREHVTDIEIVKFVHDHNIGKCIIPETCWHRIFDIARLLHTNDVMTYAVPNIEIVRKDELFKHNYFDWILCNNNLCQTIMNNYKIIRTKYIGYGLATSIVSKKNNGIKVNFLFVGGMNAFSRKQIIKVCQAFVTASDSVPDLNIHLTCTVQKCTTDELQSVSTYAEHPNITMITEMLTTQQILDLYSVTDVSIQVSKHEGLGIGFYEALSTSTPVITLDVAPYNEIITSDNGWLLPCYSETMTDNSDPVISSNNFDCVHLTNIILDIARNPQILAQMRPKLLANYFNNFDIGVFEKRFIEAIR